MTLLVVASSGAILTVEGGLLCRLVLRERSVLPWYAGFPLGTLLNALLFAIVDMSGLPLGAATILPAHMLFLIIVVTASCLVPPPSGEGAREGVKREMVLPTWLRIACLALIALTLLPGIVAALALPSTGWDVFTNWARRSQLSLEAGHFLTSGVVQPQYPILIHAAQILPNVMLADWSDRAGNAMTLLLCLSTLSCLFLILQRSRGRDSALLTLTLVLGLPLAAIHLRQGYADLPMTLLALLSAAALDLCVRSTNSRMFVLSALLCAAAAWTKVEGLYVAVLAWIPVAAVAGWKFHSLGRIRLAALGLPFLLIAPWLARTSARGLPWSPHGFNPAWHGEAVIPMLKHLFWLGSFGPAFWLLPLALCMLLGVHHRETTPRRNPVLWMGLLAFGIVMAAYLGTDDVVGLIQGDNFSRAMLPTLFLLVAGTALGWTEALRSAANPRGTAA
jgi:hypothetical protein